MISIKVFVTVKS